MGTGRFQFDGFQFDTATGELREGSRLVRLEPQPAALLALLLSQPGELVSRDDIRRHIWSDQTHVNVSESIGYCVRAIRVALGDDARAPRYVETIPRRGYRFLVVGTADGRSSAAGATTKAVQRLRLTGWSRIAAVLAIVGIVGAATWAVERRPNRHHEMAVGALRAVHGLLF